MAAPSRPIRMQSATPPHPTPQRKRRNLSDPHHVMWTLSGMPVEKNALHLKRCLLFHASTRNPVDTIRVVYLYRMECDSDFESYK